MMETKALLFNSGKSLKDQNRWKIYSYFALHCVGLAFLVLGNEPLAAVVHMSSAATIKAAWPTLSGIIIASLGSLILLGLLPTTWRDRVVHLRWRHPLPGTRAFTQIAPQDPRVDRDYLRHRFGEIPVDPAGQNQLWFKLSQETKTEPGVLEAHGNYLAARDLAWITWIILPVFGGLGFVLLGLDARAVGYAFGLLALALLLSFVAQNYAVRFVANVLAVASTGTAGKASDVLS